MSVMRPMSFRSGAVFRTGLRYGLGGVSVAFVGGLDIDGDTAAGVKVPLDHRAARRTGGDEVIKYAIHCFFVKGVVIAETEQVKFERFAFHTQATGHVPNGDAPEVRLVGNRAAGREFGAVEGDPVIPFVVAVLEGFEAGIVGVFGVARLVAPQLRQAVDLRGLPCGCR